MSDEDRLLERLASRYRVPADPLAGVIERREKRSRRRRVTGGALGVVVTGALVIGLLQFPSSTSGPHGTGTPVTPSRVVEANGLRIDIPSNYSVLTSAEVFTTDQVEVGPWGVLGSETCGWARRGSFRMPTTEYIDQFVVAAFFDDNPAPSEPTRRLVVLRDAQLDLYQLTQCEIQLRTAHRARLLQTSDATVSGFPATRLLFAPVGDGSYLPGRTSRDLLYLVDVGTARWAFDFTALGKDPPPSLAVPDFDRIIATAQISAQVGP